MIKFLERKGLIATIIGFFLSAPLNLKVTFDFFVREKYYTVEELTGVIVLNLIGIIWFILPSSITFEGGKFKFEVKD